MFKFILVSISIVGIMLACSNSKSVKKADNQAEQFDVVIEATTTQAYCGGAKPSEEVLKELNTPAPAPNVKLYLRKGEVNNIENEVDYEFVTDDKGEIKTHLPAGTYSIVFEEKKDQSSFNNLIEKYGKETSYQTAIDTTCLKKFFREPNAILEVKKNQENIITVNRMKRCQWTRIPCSNYKGELPPSAPPKN